MVQAISTTTTREEEVEEVEEVEAETGRQREGG
jgi:hypothetical protein